jgi:hypothetical protein
MFLCLFSVQRLSDYEYFAIHLLICLDSARFVSPIRIFQPGAHCEIVDDIVMLFCSPPPSMNHDYYRE